MMGNYGNYGNFGTVGWIGMIIGLVLMVAVIIGVILLIVWAARRMNSNPNRGGIQAPSNPTARDIAQARYARGEINRDEYQRILSDLDH
jgi:putative membrane protein